MKNVKKVVRRDKEGGWGRITGAQKVVEVHFPGAQRTRWL